MTDAERISTALLAIAEALDGVAKEIKWLGTGGMMDPTRKARIGGMEYIADCIEHAAREIGDRLS